VLAISAGERQCSLAARLECDEATVAHVGQVVADLTPRMAHRKPGVARLAL
jgi:hypothetical protein